MAYIASGRERDFATVIGLDVPIGIPRQQLRAMIEPIMDTLNQPVSKTQLDRARSWGWEPGEEIASGWDLVRPMMDFLACRHWVYSVCRYLTRQNWSLHSECMFNQKFINAMTCELMNQEKLAQAVLNKSPLSASTGDLWYRMSDTTERQPEFLFIAEKFGPYLAQIQIPAERSRGKARLQSENGSKSKTGCFGVVLMCLACVIATFFLI